MMLQEANDRLKKDITEEQLWKINSLYILLDLHKDDFCKIINSVGIEKLIEKQSHYERLDLAERELAAKERYIRSKERLAEIEEEKADLEKYIIGYEGARP